MAEIRVLGNQQHVNVVCPELNIFGVGIALATADIRRQDLSGHYVNTIDFRLTPIERNNYVLGPLLSLSVTVVYTKNVWDKETFGVTYFSSGELFQIVDRPAGVSGNWAWVLSADDVQRLESLRASQGDPGRALSVTVEAEGIGSIAQKNAGTPTYKTCRIDVKCPIRIPASDWVALVESVSILPATIELPTRVLSQDPYWEVATSALAQARESFHHGDAGDALHRCYDVLDRIMRQRLQNPKSAIYKKGDWEDFFRYAEDDTAGPMPRRFTALVDLFHSLGQAANILGHHAGQTAPSDRQPLEEWEAEIILQMEHLAVAYLARYIKAKTVD